MAANISFDTEILTKDGWKYIKKLSFDDKVAYLNHENYICFQNPDEILYQDTKRHMIFIQNTRVNIYGSPDLLVMCTDGFFPLEYLIDNSKTFKVITNGVDFDQDNLIPDDGHDDADFHMTHAIFAGKHAVKISSSALNQKHSHNINVFDEDVHVNPSDNNVDSLYLTNVPGPHCGVVMQEKPICIRRNGKCCWVLSA